MLCVVRCMKIDTCLCEQLPVRGVTRARMMDMRYKECNFKVISIDSGVRQNRWFGRSPNQMRYFSAMKNENPFIDNFEWMFLWQLPIFLVYVSNRITWPKSNRLWAQSFPLDITWPKKWLNAAHEFVRWIVSNDVPHRKQNSRIAFVKWAQLAAGDWKSTEHFNDSNWLNWLVDGQTLFSHFNLQMCLCVCVRSAWLQLNLNDWKAQHSIESTAHANWPRSFSKWCYCFLREKWYIWLHVLHSLWWMTRADNARPTATRQPIYYWNGIFKLEYRTLDFSISSLS